MINIRAKGTDCLRSKRDPGVHSYEIDKVAFDRSGWFGFSTARLLGIVAAIALISFSSGCAVPVFVYDVSALQGNDIKRHIADHINGDQILLQDSNF